MTGTPAVADPTPAAHEASFPSEQGRGVALALFALLAAFWPTLLSFPPTWNASYQEQGFFVAGLVAWLAWRDRRRIVRLADGGLPDLLPPLAVLSLVWWCAAVMSVRVIHQALFIAILAVWALAVFGWSARRPILAMALTASLAVPFWGVLMPALQRATVIASGAATRLAGITAEVGYDYIAISSGTFLVESGCSGINYLMGGLVLGAFYAHLFARRWQTQVKIVAVAGAMSIVGNWIRVTVLIFLGEATAMESPYIEDHLWQGWAIFTLLMIPTYFIARRIEMAEAVALDAATPRDGTEPSGATEPLDGSAATSGDPRPHRRPRLVLASALAGLGPLLFMTLGAIPRGGALERGPEVFGVAADWSVEERRTGDAWTPDFKGIDERSAWRVSSATASIDAARYYFIDQRQGEELIQYDNQVAPDSLVAADRIVGPMGATRRFVHEAIVFDGDAPRVVWYWYRVAGFDTPFDTKAKLLELLAFVTRAPAAELVVMTAPCEPDDCAGAARALREAVGVEIVEAPAG